jgi:hypothetical protein
MRSMTTHDRMTEERRFSFAACFIFHVRMADFVGGRSATQPLVRVQVQVWSVDRIDMLDQDVCMTTMTYYIVYVSCMFV